MKCKNCGRENPNEALYCMYCGGKVNPTLEDGLDAYTDPRSNCDVFAIFGLVYSIVAMFVIVHSGCFGNIIGAGIALPGFILNLISLNNIKKTNKKGKDLAIAGLVISGVLIFCCVIGFVINVIKELCLAIANAIKNGQAKAPTNSK